MTPRRDPPVDGLRQLAILLQGLDKETSAALMAQFSPGERDAITATAARLGAVAHEEQQRITSDFLRQFDVVEAGEGGRSTDAPTGSLDMPVPRPPSTRCATSNHGPRQRLATVPVDLLSAALGKEHPQTTALILTALPPQQAGAVLEMLSPRLQNEVVCRLAELDVVDEQIVDDVYEALWAVIECELVSRRARDARHDVLRSILSATSDNARSRWVAQLAETDARLATALQSEIDVTSTVAACSGDTEHERTLLLSLMLRDLEPAALEEVFHRAGDEVVLLALAGTSNTCVTALLARLPAPRAASLRSGLKAIGPLRLADVRQARQFVAHVAQQLLDRAAAEDPVASGRLKLSA